jgi:DNA modification methylase
MTPYYQGTSVTLYAGDAIAGLRELPAESVQTCITSPPYWGLRDYGTEGQLGLERTPEEYVARLVEVFREVRRVLRDDGTLWLNLGDSYCHSDKWSGGGANTGKHTRGEDGVPESWRAVRRKWADVPGLKPKDLVGIPWRVAFALQADGWWLRSDIIWAKPNPMPESVTDRPTKAHEYLFLLAKAELYYYNAEAIQEPLRSGPSDLRKMVEGKDRLGGLTKEATDPLMRASALTNMGRKRSVGSKQAASAKLAAIGSATRRMDGFNDRWDESEANGSAPIGRNRRSVWEIATQPYPEAHFATFPEALITPCVLAGAPAGGVVLDPFVGSGTTCYVARKHGRQSIGIDLKAAYLDLAAKRLAQEVLPL